MLLEIGLLVFFLAFISEYLDASLGMGFGTILVPILLIMGFHPLQVVPVILVSTVVNGFFAAAAHWRLGNVDFTLGKGSLKIAVVLTLCGIIGTVIAVLLAVSIPELYIDVYIGLVAIAMGLLLIIRRNGEMLFSWARLMGFGMLAAFNKGISGGGYGPLVVSGQILSGVDGKRAVGITSLSEGAVAVIAVALYVLMVPAMDWGLLPFVLGGSIIAVPFAALTVKRLRTRRLIMAMGGAAISLGLVIIFNLFL